jgi:hypothetical protein
MRLREKFLLRITALLALFFSLTPLHAAADPYWTTPPCPACR